MMALLHESSAEASTSNLSLFEVPHTQTSIQQTRYVSYYPLSDTKSGSVIEFNIDGQNNEYTDLSKTRLQVKLKVTKSNGDILLPTNNVGPVNNFIHSLFSQIEVSMNGTQVSSPTNTYAYRAYTDSLLNYTTAVKNSQLSSSLYYSDTSGHMNDPDALAGSNAGLLERATYIAESKTLDLQCVLTSDVFNIKKLILNGVTLRVKLYRNKEAFCLISAESAPDFKIEISEAILKVCRVTVAPSITLSHAEVLKTHPAVYPFTQTDIKTISVPSGSTFVNWDNLFPGRIPRLVRVAMVNSSAFQGSYTNNPFSLDHFSYNFMAVYVNGQSLPGPGIKTKFNGTDASGGNYIDAYMSLFTSTNTLNAPLDCAIDRDEFTSGYAITSFAIDVSSLNDEHWSLSREGNTRLEIRFDQPLGEPITVLVFAQFSRVINIDLPRNVILA